MGGAVLLKLCTSVIYRKWRCVKRVKGILLLTTIRWACLIKDALIFALNVVDALISVTVRNAENVNTVLRSLLTRHVTTAVGAVKALVRGLVQSVTITVTPGVIAR